MKESAIEAAFVKWCKANGYYTRKFSSPAHRGVPDRIVAKNGKVCFIEFKAPLHYPTAIQDREINLLRAVGLPAGFCQSLDSAIVFTRGNIGL